MAGDLVNNVTSYIFHFDLTQEHKISGLYKEDVASACLTIWKYLLS